MKKIILLLSIVFIISCKNGYETENYNSIFGKYKISKIVNQKGENLTTILPYDTLIFSIYNGTKNARKSNYGEIQVNENIRFNFYITNAFIFNGAAFTPSKKIPIIGEFTERLDYQLLIGSWEIIKIDSKIIHLRKSFVVDYKDYTKDSEIKFVRL